MAIGLWGVIRGLLVKEESDRTKELAIEVDSGATTGTRTTVSAAQTANRTLSLPDATDTLMGRATTDTVSNKTLDNSNSATLQDTNLTLQDEGDNTKQIQFDASNITASTTKVFGFPDANTTLLGDDTTQTVENKTIDATSATGNNTLSADASDIVFDNSTSGMTATNAQAAIDEAEGRLDTVESDKADGAASSTDNAIPRFDGTTGKTLQGSSVLIDDSNNMTGVNDLTVDGNLTVNGTTTTVNTATLDVADTNITVNDGGDDASSEGAGLTVERTGTDGSIVYEDALTSKFKLGALGSEVEVADVSSNQQLTNKDIDGGTASDTSRITIPQNTKSNLDGLTRKEATIVYANDLDKLYVDDGTDLREIGSGIGIKNYFDGGDFETNLDVVERYDDGGSYGDGTGGSPSVLSAPALNTTTPLAGTQDLDMAKTAADAAGEGYSFTSETIDRADYGRTMYFKAFVDATDANYTAGDLQIKAYDITNGAELPVTPVSNLDSNAGILNTNALVSAKFTLADDTAQVRVSFHMETDSQTGSTWNVYIDDILLTPEIPFQAIADGPVGEIVASGSTTTPAGFLYCDGTAVSRTVYADLFNEIGTAFGSGDGSTTFNLPNLKGQFLRGQDDSEGVDPNAGARTANNSGGNTGDNVGSEQGDAYESHSHGSGSLGADSGGAHVHTDTATSVVTNGGVLGTLPVWNISGGVTGSRSVSSSGSTHSHTVSGSTASDGGSETRPTNVYVRYYIRYKSDTNLLSTNETRLRNVFIKGRNNGGTTLTADVTNIDFTEVTDDFAAWDGSTFTAPFTGEYTLAGNVTFTAAYNGNVNVWVNGSSVDTVGYGSGNTRVTVSSIVQLNEGDTLNLRADSGATLNASGTHNISIKGHAEYTIFAVTEPATDLVPVTSEGTTYNATLSDEVILADATSGGFTVNLPTAAGISGKIYKIKKTGTDYNNVTIDPNGSETIDGDSTYILYVPGDRIELVSDGTNWQLLDATDAPIVCRADLAASDTSVTDKVIEFDTATIDTVSGLNTGTGVYTTKAPGKYRISTYVQISPSGSPNNDLIYIRVNSVSANPCFMSALPATATVTDVSHSTVVELSEGDTIDIFVDGDGSFDIDADSNMCIERISR